VDQLGLPEYFAMESYVVRRDGKPPHVEHVPTSALAAPPLGRPARTTV
jgi:hypothetical protein